MQETGSTGVFEIEDAFYLTGRGLVIAGQLTGTVNSGQHLLFADGQEMVIKGVHHVATLIQSDKFGLLVETDLVSRSDAMQAGIIGSMARIVT